MDLADLEIFVAVARRGNFAAVAKERDLDPSSVSRSMAKLEAALGLRLLQRTTRRVTLTEAGEIYNPIFRFMARFVFGYSGTIEAYLKALHAKFGETAEGD